MRRPRGHQAPHHCPYTKRARMALAAELDFLRIGWPPRSLKELTRTHDFLDISLAIDIGSMCYSSKSGHY